MLSVCPSVCLSGTPACMHICATPREVEILLGAVLTSPLQVKFKCSPLPLNCR